MCSPAGSSSESPAEPPGDFMRSTSAVDEALRRQLACSSGERSVDLEFFDLSARMSELKGNGVVVNMFSHQDEKLGKSRVRQRLRSAVILARQTQLGSPGNDMPRWLIEF